MIDLTQIETMLNSIFNDGFDLNGTKVACKSPAQITVSSVDADYITIDFNNNLPRATVKKIISLSLDIEGVIFKKDSGTIRLRHFPDINFDYVKESKAVGAYEIDSVDFADIEAEIGQQYDDENRKKLADKCLQYAKEWATIANYGGVSFKDCNFAEQQSMKRQCQSFVKESLMNDEEIKYGSIILTFILLQIILPIIIKWIVERVFKRLFN
jgi:hypothetical protein